MSVEDEQHPALIRYEERVAQILDAMTVGEDDEVAHFRHEWELARANHERELACLRLAYEPREEAWAVIWERALKLMLEDEKWA